MSKSSKSDEEKRPSSANDFKPNEVQYDENGNVRLNKNGQPVRKVGRPPKDKSLMELKKEQDALKKSIKAQRQLEFRRLLAADSAFKDLLDTHS